MKPLNNHLPQILVVLMLLGMSGNLCAQTEQELFTQYTKEDLKRPSKFRIFLSKFTFAGHTGYGRTFYKHEITDNNLNLLQTANGLFLVGDFEGVGGSTTGFTGWLNDARSDTFNIVAGDSYFSNDTTEIKYKGNGGSVPLSFKLYYNLKRFKFGVGYGLEFGSIKKLRPTTSRDTLQDYVTDIGGLTFNRFYGYFGYQIHQFRDYTVTGDLEMGKIGRGKKFNNMQVSGGFYVNLGATIERDISEYFKVFIRPSLDIKGYKLQLPETSTQIKHKQNALFIGIGVSYSIPPLKKCKLKACAVQIDHQHQGVEYRSRMHPFWKKQHPNYGENNPRLIKYKRKNRKKMNPY